MKAHIKKVVFISSPYTTGYMPDNVRTQTVASHMIMDMGHVPLTPLLYHYLEIHQGRSYAEWLDATIALMLKSDVVLRLPGESKGADKEVEVAILNNIPVCYGWDELEAHLIWSNLK